MPDIIQLLPDAIANQIAAGEVVQRPASVVKELVENSVDAGANHIKVIIKDAGRSLIQVIDDGFGMSITDARVSLERHATSKLKSSEDLFRIRTMGFRGEALASISAVSQMELKTRRQDDELGTMIEVHGSEVQSQEAVSTSKGTSICVKNLFYNIPARRNFLKSNSVEMRHIVEEFQRIAIAYPEKLFTLMQNDLEVFNLPSGKLSQRLVGIFGKNYQKQLTPISEETEDLRINGYIGKPELSKKTRGDQYFFVNGRFIKSNYLNHAVIGAYEGLLQTDTFPFYVIFLELPPEKIDVNVHPTKTEIKFEDERMVYGVIKAATRQALGSHNLSPSIDFNLDVNFGKERIIKQESQYSQFKTINPIEKPNQEAIQNWSTVIRQSSLNVDRPQTPSQENISVTFQSSLNTSQEEETRLEATKDKPVFQFQNRYIVTSVKSGMMIIDQYLAHQRILYERFQEISETGKNASQRCLFPQTIELSPGDFSLMNDIKEEVHAIGFQIEHFGTNCIVVNGIPSDLENINEKELVEDLIEQYKNSSDTMSLSKSEKVIRMISKKSAIKTGKKISEEEMMSIIDRLFACKNPNYTPDGQRTFVILNDEIIENFFNS